MTVDEKPKKHNFSDVCKQSVDSKKHLQHTEAQSCFFTLSEVCWFIYLFTQSRVENFELWVKNSASCGCHVSSKTSNQSEEVLRNTTSTPHQPHHTTSTKCCISFVHPNGDGMHKYWSLSIHVCTTTILLSK